MNKRRPIRSTSGYDITQGVLGSTLESIGIYDRSIAKMGEMEKRLLIILTLQQQMGRSDAMNDFSRTIELPANQLRVLQQQLSEVGRWIGSVFYGIIGSVLPYINGFVMAIKEVIKMFAFFVGFEIPDSSVPENVFDQIGSGFGDAEDSVDNVNSGLDDTKKKLEKIKNVMFGFDEANIMPSDKDDSSSGGGGAPSTGGLGSIDPRILDALNKYKYAFDDIEMKAKKIKEQLLDWMEILGKGIDENIFEPIQNSWNKYGASISENIENSFSNIGYVVGGVFDVVGDKWKPFFQTASDLFFSLLDTASEVSEGVSDFFVYVWDNGGKTLFEGIADLVTAFLELATSINDDFVKPVIKLIQKSFVPLIGTAVGAILGFVGNLLKGLAGIVSWIADCEILVVALGIAFTTLFLTIKIAKFIELANAIGGTHKILKTFGVLALEHSATLRKLFSTVSDGKTALNTLKTSFSNVNKILSNTSIGQKYSTMLLNIGEKALSASEQSSGLAKTLLDKLGTALTWLAGNPLVAVAGAIALVIGGLVLFASTQKDAERTISDCSEEIQAQYEEFMNLSKSIEEAGDNITKQSDSMKIQTGLASDYVDVLKEMSDENGYVDNIEKARYFVEEINKVLPDTVELTEEGRLAWKKTPEEIEKTIKSTIRLAEAQAYQEAYIESTKDVIEQQRLQQECQEKLTELYDNARVGYNSYTEEVKNGIQPFNEQLDTWEEWIEALEKTDPALADQIVLVNKQSKALDESAGKAQYFKDETIALADGLGEASDSMETLSEDTKKLSKNFEENKTKILADLVKYNGNVTKEDSKLYTTLLGNLDKSGFDISKLTSEQNTAMLKAVKDHNLDVSKEESVNYATLLKLLQDNGVDLSKTTYDQHQAMMRTMESNAIEINSEQGTQYSQMLGLLSKHGVDIGDEQNLQHVANMIKTAQHGGAEGAEFIRKLKEGVATGSINPELMETLRKAGIVLDNNHIEVGIDTESADSVSRKARSVLPRNLSFDAIMNIQAKMTSGIKSIFGQLGVPGYAEGGFPNVGQAFIANEPGNPELIGNVGGRTAVVNNKMIIESIEGAMTNAVVKGMQYGQQPGGDLYLTIDNGDGNKIEKIIRDYNRFIASNGGNGGFKI